MMRTNHKKKNKHCFVVCFLLFTYTLTSCVMCVMDRYESLLVKNCSTDTLYLEISECDTLGNYIYWNNYMTHAIDTTWVCINEENIVLDNFNHLATPGDTIFLDFHYFSHFDTCYIYAIEKRIVTSYTLDDIRRKKLYIRQAVTKYDFQNRMYEYRPTNKKRSTGLFLHFHDRHRDAE